MKRQRATAVIVKNEKLLLLRRIRPGLDYFIFPGGGVEKGETLKEALEREVREELTLEILDYDFLFTLKDIKLSPNVTIHREPMDIHFFLIKNYRGLPEIGGPERERMNEQNQYHVVWLTIEDLKSTSCVYPQQAVSPLISALS